MGEVDIFNKMTLNHHLEVLWLESDGRGRQFPREGEEEQDCCGNFDKDMGIVIYTDRMDIYEGEQSRC